MKSASTVLAFDLDGTLTPSKAVISSGVAAMLRQLLTAYDVCIISGETFGQFTVQLLDHLDVPAERLSRLHLMPTCGTQYYAYDAGQWRAVYAENFTADEKDLIRNALEQGIDALGLRETTVYGPVIEDRGSQITFSALGQDVVAQLGDDGIRLKEAWDPDGSKKGRLKDYVTALVPGFEVRSGGSTSVDVTRPGIDKAYGMRKLTDILGVDPSDVVFFGDRLDASGNDYPVKAAGFSTVSVTDPSDTLRRLKPYADGIL